MLQALKKSLQSFQDLRGKQYERRSSKHKFDSPAYEWTIFKNQDFAVQIRGWQSKDKFGWNVYALIYDSHPLFLDVQEALDLPFHSGPTYSELVTYEPAQGIRYDWQKVFNVLKLGSDYAHLYDDEFKQLNPANGIPFVIRCDAQDLANKLMTTSLKKVAA